MKVSVCILVLSLAAIAAAKPLSDSRLEIRGGGPVILQASGPNGSDLQLWVKCNYQDRACLAGLPIAKALSSDDSVWNQRLHLVSRVKTKDGGQLEHYRLAIHRYDGDTVLLAYGETDAVGNERTWEIDLFSQTK